MKVQSTKFLAGVVFGGSLFLGMPGCQGPSDTGKLDPAKENVESIRKVQDLKLPTSDKTEEGGSGDEASSDEPS